MEDGQSKQTKDSSSKAPTATKATDGGVLEKKASDGAAASRKRSHRDDHDRPAPSNRDSFRRDYDDRQKKRRVEDTRPSHNHRREPPATSSSAKTSERHQLQKRDRDPTPPPASPPRKLKRPTARGAALSQGEAEVIRKRRVEREEREAKESREQQELQKKDDGVNDFVKQHYNAVPQRDRNWRKTDSKIKGLRSFNNWVKSCLIRKFTPQQHGASVLDMGCGKGGDLQKWKSQRISHYVGLDVADVSINQAWERYRGMSRHGGGRFKASFHVFDCFGKSIKEVDQVREVGFDPQLDPRWTNGGFDVVSMMFCMHYAFENEAKARVMLSNVVGALKKGGTFIGVIPNSDAIAEKIGDHYRKKQPQAPAPVEEDDDDDWDPEKSVDEQEKDKKAADGAPAEVETDETVEWGNDIYHVKFPGHPPKDGVFRPPYGWKYFYFLEEAVEEVPEYVVPWGVFRG